MAMAGQVVMITGAAGTLGKAVAAAFADAGARLVLVDIAAKGLEAAYGAEKRQQAAPRRRPVRPGGDRWRACAAKTKFGPLQVICNIGGRL